MGGWPLKKYGIILADPAWNYRDKSKQRGGAERHYRTMNIEEIAALDVPGIADDDCGLFLWVTFPMLFEAKFVIESWGFKYKTCAFTWIKKNKVSKTNFWGMGSYTRANAEICLLATKGKPKRINADVHSVIEAPISRHSAKPPEVRERIVRLFGDLPRIELFARESVEGWDCWGNEVDETHH